MFGFRSGSSASLVNLPSLDEMEGTAGPFHLFARFKMLVRVNRGATGGVAVAGAGGSATADEALAVGTAFVPVTREMR